MDLEAFRWLLTDDGQDLLARAGALEGGELHAQAELRRSAERGAGGGGPHPGRPPSRGPSRSSAPPPRGCTSRPTGSSRPPGPTVAEHRAARLAAFEAKTLIDLGCGIGGDLLAGSAAGLTCAGVDLDPVRVAVAEANLQALGLPGAVAVADATRVDTTPFDVAYADPARRSGSGRTFRADDWQPPWSFVERLLARDACVKVAPGIPHALVPAGVEAEWVSDGGEVKEAALWSGRLASTARRATVIGDGGLATLTDDDDPGAEVRAVGEFLYEPDGAVVRAGLVTAVAHGVEGGLVDRAHRLRHLGPVLPHPVRPRLPGPRGAAVPREAAARRPARARRRPADHQEARRRRRTRTAAEAPGPGRRGRGDDRADPGLRARHGAAGTALLSTETQLLVPAVTRIRFGACSLLSVASSPVVPGTSSAPGCSSPSSSSRSPRRCRPRRTSPSSCPTTTSRSRPPRCRRTSSPTAPPRRRSWCSSARTAASSPPRTSSEVDRIAEELGPELGEETFVQQVVTTDPEGQPNVSEDGTVAGRRHRPRRGLHRLRHPGDRRRPRPARRPRAARRGHRADRAGHRVGPAERRPARTPARRPWPSSASPPSC